MSRNTFEMVAKTMSGLEDVLAEELTALGADNLQIGRRMVSFTGDQMLMYKANIHCRTALRIKKPLFKFKAKDADEVYEEIKKFKWEAYMSEKNTFVIDEVVHQCTYLGKSMYSIIGQLWRIVTQKRIPYSSNRSSLE